MAGGADAAVAAVWPVLTAMGEVTPRRPTRCGACAEGAEQPDERRPTCWRRSGRCSRPGRLRPRPRGDARGRQRCSRPSGSTEVKLAPGRPAPRRSTPVSACALMLKDMRIARRPRREHGLPPRRPLGEDAVALWAEAAEALPPEADHTEIARWVKAAPPHRRARSRSMTTHPTQESVKQEFIDVRGTWSDAWQATLELDPGSCGPTSTSRRCRWRKNQLSTPRPKSSSTSRSTPTPRTCTSPGSASTSRPRSPRAPRRRRSWRCSSSAPRWASTP